MYRAWIGVVGLVAMAGVAHAVPRITTVGASGAGSNDGTTAFGSGTRTVLGASSMTVTAMGGTSPSATVCSDDGLFAGGISSSVAARWDSTTGNWTALPTAATITSLNNVRDMSSTGQFMVGQCSTSSPGSFAGWVWDASSNTTRKLLGNTTTARAMGVSSDGLVIVGGESPNVAGTTSGGRAGVWRWNAGTSTYDWSYLPDGPVDGLGGTAYRTVDNFQINDAGTIIVGTSVKWNADAGFPQSWITRWTWNAGTLTWDRNDLYNIDGGPNTISSWWTPPSGCPLPPTFVISGMTDDGNTIVGQMSYSTCGSFYRAGFIYTGGQMLDLYDYMVTQGLDLTTPGYGTFTAGGFGGVHLGMAFDISDDGQHFYGAPIIDPDAPGQWVINLSATGGCIPPQISSNPTATTNYSACSSSVILNSGAVGTAPFTYQWTKNGSPIADGPTGNGSTYQILAGGRQMRINGPLAAADAGTYACTATNACGSATSTNGVVQVDPLFAAAPANDNCATAQAVVMGTNVLAPAQSPCGSFTIDPVDGASCATSGSKADLWYSFTPGTTGNYRIETCGANFDTVVSVFDACGGNEVACNNDYITGPTTGCSAQRSRISSVTLNSGTAYKIRVAAPASAFLSATSTVNLSITTAPTLPPNDQCGFSIPAVLGANAYNTTEATADAILALTCAASSHQSRDLWYNFTAPSRGRLNVSTCPQGTAPVGYSLMANTTLALFDAPCGTELACNDNHTPVPSGCGTQLSTINNYRMEIGSTVYIRVAGNNSSTHGAGQVNVSFFCPADLDGGANNGVPDGGVTIDDLIYYLGQFEAGNASADVDDGSGTGTLDGGVTIDDLIYYLTRFEGGC